MRGGRPCGCKAQGAHRGDCGVGQSARVHAAAKEVERVRYDIETSRLYLRTAERELEQAKKAAQRGAVL